MRLVICGGGTGGGVYPALAIWQELASRVDEVLWIGGEGGIEEMLVNRAQIPYASVPAAGMHGRGLAMLQGLAENTRGYFAARTILKQFKPDGMLFTGGFVAVPVALAGRGIPKLLYVPDIEPGLALKTLARTANHMVLIAEDSKAYFSQKQKTSVAGYPVRRELAIWKRATARQQLELAEDLPVLLVFGGSQGARSINRAVIAQLDALLDRMQVVHLSGELDWPEVESAKRSLSPERAGRYKAFPYLHETMGAAFAAADLVLSRAGASSLGEFPLFAIPAILVPYPHAWRYQMVNARYLERRGAAVILEDQRLASDMLDLVVSLMSDPSQLSGMKSAMGQLAVPDAARNIADLVLDLHQV